MDDDHSSVRATARVRRLGADQPDQQGAYGTTTMWRAFFLACGVSVLLLGLECLVVDDFILANRGAAASSAAGGARNLNPPDWAPWSLISGGAVTILYSFTIPQRVKG